jgi:hypothetical protein
MLMTHNPNKTRPFTYLQYSVFAQDANCCKRTKRFKFPNNHTITAIVFPLAPAPLTDSEFTEQYRIVSTTFQNFRVGNLWRKEEGSKDEEDSSS